MRIDDLTNIVIRITSFPADIKISSASLFVTSV